MADGTGIEWTDATWQIVTGCDIVSPGCTNCYAMKLAGGRLQHHPSRDGLTKMTKAGPVWTGEVRFNEQWLRQPLQWRRPRLIFVAAHGDLFHPGVQTDWLHKIYATMALAKHHTFQVLTKRPERARDFHHGHSRLLTPDFVHLRMRDIDPHCAPPQWPLPNVWLGTSVENQKHATRLFDLLKTPAAVHFLSAEPLLGAIDLTQVEMPVVGYPETPGVPGLFNALTGEAVRDGVVPYNGETRIRVGDLAGLGWVIGGGESGPRPMHPDWVRSLRDQCASAGVPFLFKQWGSWAHEDQLDATGRIVGNVWRGGGEDGDRGVHLWPTGDASIRIGKKAAGRLLDGVEHNGMPGGF
jgi:protein gp37